MHVYLWYYVCRYRLCNQSKSYFPSKYTVPNIQRCIQSLADVVLDFRCQSHGSKQAMSSRWRSDKSLSDKETNSTSQSSTWICSGRAWNGNKLRQGQGITLTSVITRWSIQSPSHARFVYGCHLSHHESTSTAHVQKEANRISPLGECLLIFTWLFHDSATVSI
jgi:hypothetical protein